VMRRLALQQFPRDALLKLSNNNGLREGAAVSLHRVRSLSAACRLSAPQLSRSRASVVSPHTRAGRPLHTQGRKTLLVPSPLRSPQPIPLVGGRRFFVSETTDKQVEHSAELRTQLKQAHQLWEKGECEEAIQSMHRIVALYPDDHELAEKLADMYLSMNNFKASEQYYSTAIDLLQKKSFPHTELMREWKAYLLVKRGESKERAGKARVNWFDEAEADYKKAIEVYHRCAEAYNRLGFLNLKEDYLETAEQMFDNGISQVDQQGFITAELWYGKAQCHMKKRDWSKAAAFLRKSCEADPTYAPPCYDLGKCLQENKDWVEAIHAYDQYFERFLPYYSKHQFEVAQQSLDPTDLIAELSLRRGMCYIHVDLAVALQDLEGCIEMEKSKVLYLAYYFRGQCRFKQADFWKAIDDQTEAIKLNPEFPDAYKERATCYDIVGLAKEAEEDKKRCEQLKQTNSWKMRQATIEGYFKAP